LNNEFKIQFKRVTMNCCKFTLFLLVCSYSFALQGQSYSSLAFNYGERLDYFDNDSFQMVKDTMIFDAGTRIYRKPNGKLFFYLDDDYTKAIYTKQGELMPEQPYFPNNSAYVRPLGLDTFGVFSRFVWYQQAAPICSSIQQYMYKNNPNIDACEIEKSKGVYLKTVKDSVGIPVNIKKLEKFLNLEGKSPMNFFKYGFKRIKNFEYGTLYAAKQEGFKVTYYFVKSNYQETIITDSVMVDFEPYIPLKYRDTTQLSFLVSPEMIASLSHGCSNGFQMVNIQAYSKINSSLFKWYSNFSVYFNISQSQQIQSVNIKLIDERYDTNIPNMEKDTGIYQGISPDFLIYSPDNRYIINYNGYSPYNSNLYYGIYYGILTINDVRNNYLPIDTILTSSNNGISSIGIMHTGALMISENGTSANPKLHLLKGYNSNSFETKATRFNVLGRNYNIDNTNYDYLRIKPKVQYTNCGAELTFTNWSDESLGIDTYYWSVAKNKEHTQWANYSAKEPPKTTFTENGTYFVKLHGVNSKDPKGYAEWWWDSIEINIPTPPTANFRTNSPICLFTPLAFDNQSNQGQVNPNTGVSYLWSFGDGTTSNAAFPKHSYTTAGVYDAQLIVNNGYCADTLLKKQYIRAIDAPQPGMVLNETEACSPFNLTITEINKRPVVKRSYTMGDGQTENPTANSFSYLYNQPGSYQIIQILESTSGCVARDTITLRLRKGFAPTDSAKMMNGTYLNNQTIALQWQPLQDAAGYQIFGSPTQNGVYNKIKELSGNTTQTTIEGFTPKVQFFGVTGIDSCGNYSAMGNISAPIFLQHTQNGNTSVALDYTAYLDWQVPISSYEIEYTYGADTQILASQNIASPYTDYSFAQTESTLKCYRITAHSTDGRKTQSNIVCAGMVPIVFIPNAFTPNKDGLNDVFTPNTIGVESYEMQIFTRCGELVSKTENTGWDAGNAPEGVYKVLFYGKSATGERINIMSNVLLLK